MAALDDTARVALWADFMRQASSTRVDLALTKSQLRAAVDATDDWIEANQGSFNAALPQPARSVLTAKDKTKLFMAVAGKRFGVF